MFEKDLSQFLGGQTRKPESYAYTSIHETVKALPVTVSAYTVGFPSEVQQRNWPNIFQTTYLKFSLLPLFHPPLHS